MLKTIENFLEQYERTIQFFGRLVRWVFMILLVAIVFFNRDTLIPRLVPPGTELSIGAGPALIKIVGKDSDVILDSCSLIGVGWTLYRAPGPDADSAEGVHDQLGKFVFSGNRDDQSEYLISNNVGGFNRWRFDGVQTIVLLSADSGNEARNVTLLPIANENFGIWAEVDYEWTLADFNEGRPFRHEMVVSEQDRYENCEALTVFVD